MLTLLSVYEHLHVHPQSCDGIEQTLQVNYYAHALMTLGLLERLRARPGSRTIMVNSKTPSNDDPHIAQLLFWLHSSILFIYSGESFSS